MARGRAVYFCSPLPSSFPWLSQHPQAPSCVPWCRQLFAMALFSARRDAHGHVPPRRRVQGRTERRAMQTLPEGGRRPGGNWPPAVFCRLQSMELALDAVNLGVFNGWRQRGPFEIARGCTVELAVCRSYPLGFAAGPWRQSAPTPCRPPCAEPHQRTLPAVGGKCRVS